MRLDRAAITRRLRIGGLLGIVWFVVFFATLSGCTSLSPPTKKARVPPPAQGKMVPSTAQEQEPPPQLVEEDATPPLAWQVIPEFSSSEVPTYEWANSPAGIDFLEAAFRFQFANNPANPDALRMADFVFLGINVPEGIVDPPWALMSRFKDLSKVEPVSKADITGRSVKHREWDGRSVLFVIENLRLVDDATIEVVLHYRGGCGSWDPYRFERREGKWVMVRHGGWSKMS